jgi:signal transduction histidine kinase
VTGPPVTGSGADDRPGGDLDILTGLRSGKHSYYQEYVRSADRLEHAVQALDRISGVLVRTGAGPRPLVEAVVRTAAAHLGAQWLLFAVAEGVLPAARPRFLMVTSGELIDDENRLPAEVAGHLAVLRSRPWEIESPDRGQGWVRISMTLEDEPVGGIAARPGAGLELADTDRAILRVLANQAALALHNSQRQALYDERHRIARELHDSVTQSVLSIGMTIEVCRAELANMAGPASQIAERLGSAKDLARHAAEQLRTAIYALNHAADEPAGSLPVMLQRLSTVHQPANLNVKVRLEGQPIGLPPRVEQSVLRWTGEALFNAAAHGQATCALVRLRYLPGAVAISVSDNGTGDPAQLRRALRLSSGGDLSGLHRGLANMLDMAESLGGTLSIRQSRAGGVLLRLGIPLPLSGALGVRPWAASRPGPGIIG